MTAPYFCVRYKNRRKHKQHSSLSFFKIVLHFSTSGYISTQEKLYFLPMSFIYLGFSSLGMQRRIMQTKIYHKSFYSVIKETLLNPLKVAAAKKYFPSVYISDTTCFNEYFLFHVITGRHYFLYKFVVTQWFGATAKLLHSSIQVF